MPATFHGFLTLCYCHFFDRKTMTFLSRTTQVLIQLVRHNELHEVFNNCPAIKISRSPANGIIMGHDEAVTYSFSRA